MKFNIVTLNSSYRGICRLIKTDDFLTKKTRKYYDELISCYFEYIELMYKPINEQTDEICTFNELIRHYTKFKSFGVNCEIIVYDSSPLKNAFEEQIELLGIDVVCDMAESLLENPISVDCVIKKHLNQFGLCKQLSDIDVVLNNSNCGNNDWRPCWVYRVNR